MSDEPTKGPWKFTPTNNEVYNLDHGTLFGDIMGGEHGNIIIAHVWPNKAEANEHLLAAAPDLLEALQGMLPENNGTGDSLDFLAYTRARINAEVAIAKAKGQDL